MYILRIEKAKGPQPWRWLLNLVVSPLSCILFALRGVNVLRFVGVILERDRYSAHAEMLVLALPLASAFQLGCASSRCSARPHRTLVVVSMEEADTVSERWKLLRIDSDGQGLSRHLTLRANKDLALGGVNCCSCPEASASQKECSNSIVVRH